MHADQGPMKGETLLATLYRLGIATSYSRPRIVPKGMVQTG